MSDWYDVTGAPSTSSSLSSAAIRGEFLLIQTAMAKLPTITGNGSRVVTVNAGATALESVANLTVSQGGTGATSLTDGGILLGSGTGAITAMSVLADGAIVVGDGATDPVALAAFTESTGTLKHEYGGLELDISAIGDGDFIVGTGVGTLGLESGATARASLGVAIGSDVQAYDDDLTAIAALANTDGNFIVGNGSAWVAENGATARTSLGLGSIATQAANSVDIDGGAIDGVTIGSSSADTGTFTQIDVDNIRIDLNTISATNTNGNIILVPDTGGDLRINTGGSETARFTSTGLLALNGASAAEKITLTGGGSIINRSSGTTFNSGYTSQIQFIENGDGNGELAVYTFEGGSGGGEKVRIADDGKVGIGTDTPASELHVVYDTQAVAATQLLLESATGGFGAGISFQSNLTATTTLTEMGKITVDAEDAWTTTASTQDARLDFFTCENGVVTQRMRLGSNGTLTIGSASVAQDGTVILGNGLTSGNFVQINGTAGADRAFLLQTNGSSRWQFGNDATAESGSNAGSHFFMNRFADNGSYIDTPFKIFRDTGYTNLNGIELGNNQTDTTITRSSAGRIAVEGNNVAMDSVGFAFSCLQIDIGHASDTTLTRSAAGRLAVEGVNVILANGSVNFTGDPTISKGVPAVILRDDDSTGSGVVANIIYQDSGSIQRAYCGFGSAANTDFTIENNLGNIVLNPATSVEFADSTVSRPKIADYGITYQDHGNTGATETIDLENGNVHRIVLDQNTTLTFSNPPASGTYGEFRMIVVQDATGSRTITWPASLDWGGGSAPTLSTAANAIDIFDFFTVDGGSTWYGALLIRDGK